MSGLTPDEQRRIDAILAPRRTMHLLKASTVEPRRTRFLWHPYLPVGKVVIVAGAPGHGKSQLAALMAGMASRGALPGDLSGEPAKTLMMCAEDDPADTVVPRLMAVNADLDAIDFINVVTEYPGGLTETGMIRLPSDYAAVHAWAQENLTARLIVMDPVASFFDRSHSAVSNQDVRDALGPIVAIAQTFGITVVIILHLNKSESRDFMGRIAESHGFQALARSVLALGPDPDDPDGERGSKKVIAVTKANLIRPGMYGLRCEVRTKLLTAGLPEPIETSELVLLGKCEISADDLLMPSAERKTRNAKKQWLDEFLDGGWCKSKDVQKAAQSDGWSWKQIDEYARSQGYPRQRVGFQGPVWMGALNADPRAIPEYPGSKGSMGETGDSNSPIDPIEPRFRGIARGDSLPFDQKNGRDLDAYREFEQRKLGERDDDDDA